MRYWGRLHYDMLNRKQRLADFGQSSVRDSGWIERQLRWSALFCFETCGEVCLCVCECVRESLGVSLSFSFLSFCGSFFPVFLLSLSVCLSVCRPSFYLSFCVLPSVCTKRKTFEFPISPENFPENYHWQQNFESRIEGFQGCFFSFLFSCPRLVQREINKSQTGITDFFPPHRRTKNKESKGKTKITTEIKNSKTDSTHCTALHHFCVKCQAQ